MRTKYIFSILFLLLALISFSQKKEITKKNTAAEKKVEKDSLAQALKNVEIKGKSKKQKIETSGFAVAIIETKEASLRNLTTNELLDRSVGVRVRQNGGIGSNVEYNLNGMSGSTVGIFIDGLEASTYGQSFNLNNIPPSMIERIEVYKGVLPAHLTGDYVGGAINVVLKKDVSKNSANAAVSYGSFNTFQSDAGVTFREKKTGLSFRGSGFYTYTDNSFETWGRSTTYVNEWSQIIRHYRAKRFNNDYKSLGGRFEAGFTDTKWADQFFIGYNGSSNYTEIPHGTTMAIPYVGRFNETKAHAMLLNYNKRNFLVKDLALNINAVRSDRNTYLQDTVGYAYNWDGKIRTTPISVIDYDENGNPKFRRDTNGNIIYRDNTTIPDTLTKTIHIPLKTLQGGQQGRKVMTSTDRKITNARTNLGYMITNGHRISLNHKYESTDRKDEDLFNPNSSDLATKSTITKNIISMNYEAETFNRKLTTNILGKYTTNQTKQIKSEIVTTDGVNSLVKNESITSDNNFGYGATASYNVIPALFIIGSMENSYIMPTDTQLYGASEINILENLQLEPEKFINYNLGLRWNPSDFGKHKVSLYANAFWRNGYNKITQQAVADSEIENEEEADIQTTRYVNLGRTQARGFEAEIIYIYNNRLNTSLNFSKFNNVFKQEFDENGKPHAYYGQQVVNEPFFTANANFQYRFNNVFQKKSILNTYYSIGYVGEYYIVWGQPDWSLTPTQFTHDLGASYRFPSGKLVASLDVKNLLNADIYDNFAIQKPGRGIFFKLNYTFSKF
ncbi:TonB-dependent receptor plug domain-containing protein [Flavobacterium aquicola]|uniref:Outer membrane receptor protein involved in Fe transport n=1 Tax=Flavobacterium aquicola TaxID=1682742 RepID=A0A3E0EE77_9FLAO|nr:TonB-dependent receptor plug domain-containing protein [Flavobacterium aquicola]REG96481.1 outer membrane receptor protein involved in Fe transport [Flavobacterium aquicola]